MPDMLEIDRIQAGLQADPNSQHLQLHYFDHIDSTNRWLLQQGKCGDVCIAAQQSNGQGRQGKSWHSPNTGNLYFSLMDCLPHLPPHFSLLSLVVAVALAESLSNQGMVEPAIKWPNDLHSQGRKLGGILLQSHQSGQVVIGIGLNINMPSEHDVHIDQAWANIESINHNKINRSQLLLTVLRDLSYALATFNSLNVDEFIQRWHQWDALYDQLISIKQATAEQTGVMQGIDQTGRLRLLDENGKLHYFSSGDVSIRLAVP